jgi:hypothetical protein
MFSFYIVPTLFDFLLVHFIQFKLKEDRVMGIANILEYFLTQTLVSK